MRKIKKGQQIILLESMYYSEQFGGILTKKEADDEGYNYSRIPYFKSKTKFTAEEDGDLNSVNFYNVDTGQNFNVDSGFGPRKVKVLPFKKKKVR